MEALHASRALWPWLLLAVGCSLTHIAQRDHPHYQTNYRHAEVSQGPSRANRILDLSKKAQRRVPAGPWEPPNSLLSVHSVRDSFSRTQYQIDNDLLYQVVKGTLL